MKRTSLIVILILFLMGSLLSTSAWTDTLIYMGSTRVSDGINTISYDPAPQSGPLNHSDSTANPSPPATWQTSASAAIGSSATSFSTDASASIISSSTFPGNGDATLSFQYAFTGASSASLSFYCEGMAWSTSLSAYADITYNLMDQTNGDSIWFGGNHTNFNSGVNENFVLNPQHSYLLFLELQSHTAVSPFGSDNSASSYVHVNDFSFNVTTVPLPPTVLLLGSGLLGLGAAGWRRKRRQ
jgi:hypothetical protein